MDYEYIQTIHLYIPVVVIFSAPMPKSTSPSGLEVRASD